MTSREIVEKLNNINKEYNQDIIRKAANKIEELRKYIDDSTNDHFTDTLEYYADRCHRLDCEIDILKAGTPHISRVTFCRILETLKRNEDFYDEMNEVFRKFHRDSIVCSGGIEDALVGLLETYFKDQKNNWISYWVWELDFGRKFKEGDVQRADGSIVSLETADELYDFLIECMEEADDKI